MRLPKIPPLKNFIATSAALALLASFASAAAPADLTVTQLEGSLLSKATDGTLRVLSVDSKVHTGDVLLSRSGSYAQVRLGEEAQMTLGPETELRVITAAPRAGATLNLMYGSISLTAAPLTGSLPKNLTLMTPSATITITDATLLASYRVPTGTARWGRAPASNFALADATSQGRLLPAVYHPDAPFSSRPSYRLAQNTVPPNGAGLNPGLYVQVLDGAINVSNGGGTQNFTAGQFGYTPSFQQPPVILPTNPGMQFTPPPSFTSTTGSAGSPGAVKPGDVDCQVR